jgi:hypothetical protein
MNMNLNSKKLNKCHLRIQRPSPKHTIQLPKAKNKDLKAKREKYLVIYKDCFIRLSVHFSSHFAGQKTVGHFKSAKKKKTPIASKTILHK